MMLIIAAAFLACAAPLSFAWYFGWRFMSGLAGGVVMVLVAGTVLPHIPNARRGTAGGAIFLGLGLGIAGSGTIVPLLLNLRIGPRPTVRLVVLIQAAAMLGVYATSNQPALVVLTVFIGTFAPGIVPLALARVRELIPDNAHRQNAAWGRTTILSAAGYAFSALLNISGCNHRLLFLTSALLLAVFLGDFGYPRPHRWHRGDASALKQILTPATQPSSNRDPAHGDQRQTIRELIR